MMENFLKNKIRQGSTVVGVWNILASSAVTELISLAGYDFQILDLEHGLYDMSSIQESIRICELLGCSPLVRMADLNQAGAQKILDVGAHGLIFPQISSFNDAKIAVANCFYPPVGRRGYNPFTRGNSYAFTNSSIKRDINNFGLSGLIIENQTAYFELDKILEIENLDIIYLGAYDMSVSLGKPGDMDNPDLIKFLENGITKIRKSNKSAGVMVKTTAECEYFKKLGANIILAGVDSHIIGKNLKSLRESIF